MVHEAQKGLGPPFDERSEGIALKWQRALAGTSYVPLSAAEILSQLRQYTDRLLMILVADPFMPRNARQLGDALVHLHFTQPESLGCTLAVLGAAVLADRDPAQQFALAPRLVAVLGEFATGFTSAMRASVLTEQEGIREAVLVAQQGAEEALRRSEARFHAVFAQAAIGMGIGDMTGRILDANATLQTMFGYTLEEFHVLNVGDLVHPDDAAAVWESYAALISGARNHFQIEKQFFRKDGQIIWSHLTVSLVRGATGTPTFQIAMLEDVTERKQLESKLAHQAFHDALTGLPNRALFMDRLQMALARSDGTGTVIAVLFLDLDGFKVINDSLGHDAGDQLLVAVAERLQRCVPPTAGTIARLGGDEFTLLLAPVREAQEVLAVAGAIIASLETPVMIGGAEVSISASIGVVVVTADERRPMGEVLRDADITLYRAKAEGKGKFALFDTDTNATTITRYTLAAELRRALERGEFVVHYQPLIRLVDGTIVGTEALVRWQHPQRGLLLPEEFIGTAEETGMIVPLDLLVLQEACRQGNRWRQQYPHQPLLMSVNLAARRVHPPEFVPQIAAALRASGLPPTCLQLEVTESTLLHMGAENTLLLETLAAMGIRLAIDDFGTGYANLACLRTLPFHTLKIGHPFMSGLQATGGQSTADGAIIETMITLAHKLGLGVTAEYVETEAQRTLLQAFGCNQGQGWLFGAAGPATMMETRLDAQYTRGM